MKIGLLHYSSPPIVGGVEKILGRHAELFAHHGHSVRVISGQGAVWHRDIEVKVHPLIGSQDPRVLDAKSALEAGNLPKDFARITSEIETFLRSTCADLDLLIAHNVCSLDKNLALTAALKSLIGHTKKPALVAWHHDLAFVTSRSQANLHSGFPWDLLIPNWPDVMHITISENRRQEIASLSGLPTSAISVIPNGIDLVEFLNLDPETSKLVSKLNLFEARPLILLPVRITRRKNIELAISVIASLQGHLPKAQLLVTGPLGAHNPSNAEYFKELCKLREHLNLRRSVRFLAEISDIPYSDSAIASLYRIADVLLLPSIEEGFGLPLIEAAAAKLPIVCSDIPVLRELGCSNAEYFPIDATPAQIAQKIYCCLTKNDAYKFATRIKDQYLWSSIYEKKINPILAKVVEI